MRGRAAISDIRQWLEELGLGQYADAFEENDIGVDVLDEVTDQDLREIGVSLGDRKRLLKALGTPEQGTEDSPAAEDFAVQPAPFAPDAERRQITVMFCDLVGSTALSTKLDPEDLRAIMAAYQQAAGTEIARYEGHVAQYLGDGLMTYFGWPKAHEDDTQRAVRAGLDIIEAISPRTRCDASRTRAKPVATAASSSAAPGRSRARNERAHRWSSASPRRRRRSPSSPAIATTRASRRARQAVARAYSRPWTAPATPSSSDGRGGARSG